MNRSAFAARAALHALAEGDEDVVIASQQNPVIP